MSGSALSPGQTTLPNLALSPSVGLATTQEDPTFLSPSPPSSSTSSPLTDCDDLPDLAQVDLELIPATDHPSPQNSPKDRSPKPDAGKQAQSESLADGIYAAEKQLESSSSPTFVPVLQTTTNHEGALSTRPPNPTRVSVLPNLLAHATIDSPSESQPSSLPLDNEHSLLSSFPKSNSPLIGTLPASTHQFVPPIIPCSSNASPSSTLATENIPIPSDYSALVHGINMDIDSDELIPSSPVKEPRTFSDRTAPAHDFSALLAGIDMDDFETDEPLPSSQPNERSQLLEVIEPKGKGKRVSLEGNWSKEGEAQNKDSHIGDLSESKRRKVDEEYHIEEEDEEALGLDLTQHPTDPVDVPASAFVGFQTGGGKAFKAPSQAALLAAAKLIESDLDTDIQKMLGLVSRGESSSQPIRPTGLRPAQLPTTTLVSSSSSTTSSRPIHRPTMTSLSSSNRSIQPVPPSDTLSEPPSSAPSSIQPSSSSTNPSSIPPSSSTPVRPTTFRIPSVPLSISTTTTSSGTPIRKPFLTGHLQTSSRPPFRSPLNRPPSFVNTTGSPASSSNITSSIGGSNSVSSTPLRRIGVSGGLGLTPRSANSVTGEGARRGGRGAKRTGFSTPFKAGVTAETILAGEASRRESREGILNTTGGMIGSGVRREKTKANGEVGVVSQSVSRKRVFDLSPVEGRKTMAEAYIRPEFNSIEELREMGVPEDIWKLNLLNAPFYSFIDPSDESRALDLDLVRSELIREGCVGATRDWVENHWSQILWKLACIVRGRPALFAEGKFSWEELGRQIRYRYEREYNQGHRSSLKLIHEQVVSPASSLILCISQITWGKPAPPEPGHAPNQTGDQPVPILELTDGWYKIKANVDDCLTRAVKRGKLRVGCKVGMNGVRLEAKEGGAPPLLSFSSTYLTLTGNTTSLARWDAKLGFQPRPFIACLTSLSPDGGLIPTMDIVILKCFPIGYVDAVDLASGAPPGFPRGEKEERALQDKWNDRQEAEKQKIASELTQKLEDLLGLIDKIERLSRGFKAKEDGGAGAEDLFDDLENATDQAAFLRTIEPGQLAELASFMKRKYQEDGSKIGQDILDEIDSRCPPREVRSFRVIKFRDFQSNQPALRNGQLTLWDALSFGDEGLIEGKRYLVSNLAPGQKGAWAPPGKEGDVYVNSRKDSQWREVS
ncbi:rad51-associated protein brh2 [Phaffia rhodozyma]|uniref:Rad51-associated protein brh2 n=1 Tax=Phaffia rhodozyma TaxID=264483 RepID=A0A0F7SLK9_PHARH|nr:rad51-associated protein brh2 [Phaffia rhodozyma]